MKPKKYFILTSLAFIVGLVGLILVTIFLISLMAFSLRTHGPMGAIRYQLLLSSFPWWAVIISILGISISIVMLKKFDFSYRKNFVLIIIGFILAVIASGFLINFLELDNLWIHRGPMRGIYRKHIEQRQNRVLLIQTTSVVL